MCGVPAGWVEDRTGVAERRWVSGKESAITLGVQAATEALNDAGVQPGELDLILNASGTPYQAIPDNAAFLQRELGLGSSGIPSFSIHATCLSFLPALDLAAEFIASGRAERILIVSSEVASPGLNFAEPESAALMGDAAAAVVVTSGDSVLEAFRMETYGDTAALSELRGGGTHFHPNSPTLKPEDSCFTMQGKPLLKFVKSKVPAFLENLRSGLSSSLGDVDQVVPHQASNLGLRLLPRYGWPDDQIVKTLPKTGNCIAASIPVALYEAVRDGRIQRGSRVLFIGTGAGLSIGGAILKY
ncbi:MAG: 3-oxoacyl-[acyl-carrier-protein] synthase-3 [Verrucomicrobiales bacterium]